MSIMTAISNVSRSCIIITVIFSGICNGLQRSFKFRHFTTKVFLHATNFEPSPLKRVGSSDLMVSNVCLGTMTWGQQNTESEGIEQLNVAFDEYGVNFLDTAEMYPVPTKAETQGATDRIIGKWLYGRDRTKVILATKVSGFGGDRLTYLPGRDGQGARVSSKQIIASVDYSLERLGTNYIDILQIHWPDRYVPLWGDKQYDKNQERESIAFEEQLIAIDSLIKTGKVRNYGLSNETPYGVMKFCHTAEKLGIAKPISIQNCYSLLVRSDFESGLVEVCTPSNENIALLPYSPLSGGMLTGKYMDPNCPKSARLNLFQDYMARYKQSLAQEVVAMYCDIAKKHGHSPAQLALLWCKQQPHVTSTIIGATSVAQLRENLEAFDKNKELSAEAVADINEVYKRYRDPSSR